MQMCACSHISTTLTHTHAHTGSLCRHQLRPPATGPDERVQVEQVIMITMQILSLMGALVYILTARRHYSRSIGTDVRFILFLVGEYDGAKVPLCCHRCDPRHLPHQMTLYFPVARGGNDGIIWRRQVTVLPFVTDRPVAPSTPLRDCFARFFV